MIGFVSPLTSDEWESFKRAFNDAFADVAERTGALRRASNHLERLAARARPRDVRVAIRQTAKQVRIEEEDIVDRLSALGRASNRLRDSDEL